MKYEIQKHNDYWIFPVIVFVYDRTCHEFNIELGLIKYTISFTIKTKR